MYKITSFPKLQNVQNALSVSENLLNIFVEEVHKSRKIFDRSPSCTSQGRRKRTGVDSAWVQKSHFGSWGEEAVKCLRPTQPEPRVCVLIYVFISCPEVFRANYAEQFYAVECFDAPVNMWGAARDCGWEGLGHLLRSNGWATREVATPAGI
jgi:hypothetical protein